MALRYGKVTVITACGIPAGGCPLSWFQANHPNWILLKHDRATPAYEWDQTDWIPLDVSNPEVQAWREAHEIAPMLSNGYQGISVDNVGDQNDWGAEGVCSVAVTSGDCASNGGTWTQLYSGEVAGDQRYINDRVTWLNHLASYVHDRNACLSENIAYDPTNTAATASFIGTADIWYDEPGFTGDSNPSACAPDGGGSGVTGQAWIDKVAFVNGLKGGAGVPNVQENSICPLGDPRTRTVLEYATASYLLTKNAHTYFLWFFDNGKTGDSSSFTDQSPGGIWPELYWSHGAAQEATTVVGGVYRRMFANGLALLNPSTSGSAPYALGNSVYHSFDGHRFTGTITLPPVTGKVLIVGEPPAAAKPEPLATRPPPATKTSPN